SDPDGNLDPSTVQVTVDPPNGSVTCDGTGVCTYTPDPGFSGPDSFEYQVCDTDGACDTATVNITVTAPPPPPPVNNPPVATDDVATTAADTSVPIGVTANDFDPDGNLDPSTAQITVVPPNGSVTCAANGVCTYTPDPGFSGPDSFEYQVCDTDGACDTATVNITVSAPPPPPNNPPVATDDVAITSFETPVAVGVSANDTDPDGNLDPSTVQVTSNPSNGSVSCANNGVCTYTPDPGFSGSDSFEYEVCDTNGACDGATVTVTVDPPPNNPPVATDDTATTTPGTAVAIGVIANDTDADGNLDPSTVKVTSNPSNGTVTCDNTGICTYTPDTGFTGTDSFEYEICDTDGACDTATVTVTVSSAPTPNPAVDPEPTPTPAPGDGGGGGNGGGSQDEDPAETEVLSESRTAAVEMVSGTLPFTGRAIDKLLLIAAILLMTGSTCLVLSRFSSATERDRGFWGRRKPRYYGF
ncbi:MAG: Ig-like domain-containing protein, partial [Actinomycetota bacterium]